MLPTTGDLSQFLTGEAGLVVGDIDRLEFYLADAYDVLQTESGLRPFAAKSQTRTFYPARKGPIGHYPAQTPDRIVRFDCGLIGDHSSVQIAVSINGTAVPADKYRLKPDNAPSMERPYTWMEFLYPVAPGSGGIQVAGPWGWSERMPAKAFMAVLQHAAHLFAVAYRTGKFDTAVSWSEGDTSESKAQQLLSTMGDAWRDQAVAAMRTYQLTELIV